MFEFVPGTCDIPCSNTLVEKIVTVPATLFNSGDTTETVINSYDEIFTDALTAGCVVNSCSITTGGACGT